MTENMEQEIKLAKLEHEEAVLNARKMELRKQTLEAKQTLVKLDQESLKINERINDTKNSINNLLQGE